MIAVQFHGLARIRDAWLSGPWPYTFGVEHLVVPEYETAFGLGAGVLWSKRERTGMAFGCAFIYQ